MTQFSRRNFISRTSLTAVSLIALPHLSFPFQSSQKTSFVKVKTQYGKLRGLRENGVNIFKGVPYAGSVSGDRRFRSPAPLQPWKGTRDALQLGNPALQMPVETYGIDEPDPAEDCLFLNIWTPAIDDKKRPVMFYNHGGGFSHGSGGSVAQDGANLARKFDVVVVQTNHRLGMMGYLYLDEIAGEEYAGSGNMGLLDIVEGLKWVHENIEVFGGDPNNVMIWGESGGGAKTSCLYGMPAAAPFFNKASIESGPGVHMTTPEIANQNTLLVLKELKIDPKNWQKLLTVPSAELMALQAKLPAIVTSTPAGKSIGIGPAGPGGFSPVVDGKVLPHHPFDPTVPVISKDKPLMTGWNEDEYTFFGWISKDHEAFNLDEAGLIKRLTLRYGDDANRILNTYKQTRPEASPTDLYVEMMTMSFAGLGSTYIAEQKAKQNGAPVYLYNFGYKSESIIPGTNYKIGTPHAMDIAFKFNNIVPLPEQGEPTWNMAGYRPERYEASENMAELFTTFARTGKPGGKNIPEWKAYDLESRPTMRIDTTCEVINNRNEQERAMWESLGYK